MLKIRKKVNKYAIVSLILLQGVYIPTVTITFSHRPIAYMN